MINSTSFARSRSVMRWTMAAFYILAGICSHRSARQVPADRAKLGPLARIGRAAHGGLRNSRRLRAAHRTTATTGRRHAGALRGLRFSRERQARDRGHRSSADAEYLVVSRTSACAAAGTGLVGLVQRRSDRLAVSQAACPNETHTPWRLIAGTRLRSDVTMRAKNDRGAGQSASLPRNNSTASDPRDVVERKRPWVQHPSPLEGTLACSISQRISPFWWCSV